MSKKEKIIEAVTYTAMFGSSLALFIYCLTHFVDLFYLLDDILYYLNK